MVYTVYLVFTGLTIHNSKQPYIYILIPINKYIYIDTHVDLSIYLLYISIHMLLSSFVPLWILRKCNQKTGRRPPCPQSPSSKQALAGFSMRATFSGKIMEVENHLSTTCPRHIHFHDCSTSTIFHLLQEGHCGFTVQHFDVALIQSDPWRSNNFRSKDHT